MFFCPFFVFVFGCLYNSIAIFEMQVLLQIVVEAFLSLDIAINTFTTSLPKRLC